MSGSERSVGVCIVISVAAFVVSGSLLLRSVGPDLFHTSPITLNSVGGKPVRVRFVGESLCPDCAAFTTKVLEPTFSSGLKDLIELDYVGWGNAKNNSGEVECQHGPRECELNIALNCAQQLSQSQEDFFDFLYCLEREAFSSTGTEVLQTCSNSGRLSEKALRECSNGKLGKELERAAAAATPPHQYVPWILVDDVPLGADCGNLATYICAAYTGKKPEACYKAPQFLPCPGAPVSSLVLS